MKKKAIFKISAAKGLKRNMDLGLADVEIRWDAMSKFVDNAAEYGVGYAVEHDLAEINRIREQQGGSLPSEYQISTHNNEKDKKVKLTFNKEHTLFEFEQYTNFIAHETHQNLQAKFFFDDANKLTKVSYHNKSAMNCGYFHKEYDGGKKVISLTQKQINQESATEMTK